ncbi:MAG: sugar phosphate isomerase/epimerase [Verrucomicrobiae bacterium]|nr:sugar phosphate isomerase/epimerase [Verrucomicrobiae bacterium]
MKQKRTASQRWTGTLAALLGVIAAACGPTPVAESAAPARFEVGICAYTFRHLTAFEAIEKTKECGADVIEFFLWQKLSPENPKVILNADLSDEHIAALKAKLEATGVRAVNAYFNNAPFQDKAGVEAGVRKLFEFARKLGLRGLTGEPPVEHLDLVEKMVKEFNIQLCFHNHPINPKKPDYRNWDPKYLLALMDKRDPRMGFSVDTGHLARSGVDSIETLKLFQKRVHSVHLKDVKEARPESDDLPYGQGIANIKGILAELKRQDFRGHVGVEYEHQSDRLLDDVKFCIQFIRTHAGLTSSK